MTQNDWPEVKLGDHINIRAGYAFDSDDFTDDPNDIPLVKGSNVQQRYVDWDNSKYWPEEKLEGFERFLLKEGDIVLAMDRPWVQAGLKWAWIQPDDPPALLVQRIARMRAKNGLTQGYLRYLIGSPQFTAYIRPIVTGTNVPHISQTQIKNFTFNLPPADYQKKVATLLSQYDDLISNNLERIGMIERFSKLLYNEWFRNFRFPGHSETPLTESPIGEIPEGWEVKKLEEVVKLSYGKGLTKSERQEGNVPVYGSSGVVGWHDESLVEGPSIVVGRKGNVGSIYYEEKNLYPIDTTYYVVTDLPLEYVYYHLKDMNFINSDAAVPGLNRDQAYSQEFLVPPKNHLERFVATVSPFWTLSQNLEKRNNILDETRNFLQTHLLSGDVDITNIELDRKMRSV